MCSQEELIHTEKGFQYDVRSDGRSTEELRSLILETGQLVQASGSARLKLGLTDVLVAVKVRNFIGTSPALAHALKHGQEVATRAGLQVELGTPSPDRPDCGNIFFAVECSPCANPQFQVCSLS